MITINTLQITPDRKTLNVSISTDVGQEFTQVRLWTELTFKSGALTFNSKVIGQGNDVIFTITSNELNINAFDGLYFLEFENQNEELKLGAVAELTTYKQCLLDETLKLLSSDPDIINNINCQNSKFNKIIFINTILNSLQASMLSGYYGEAKDLIALLKKTCTKCTACPTLNSILSLGTLNNNIILI